MRGARAAGPALAVAVLLAAGLVAPASAQQDRRALRSPVLTVDQEALFERSAFGARTLSELEAASAELAAENRAIEADLAAEERALTDERPTMDPEAFRALAADFDARVVELRRRQDQKARDLARRPDEARQAFLRAALPILAELVRERGAVAILDSRAVLLSADQIDITDQAVARIDARLGDGPNAPPQPPSPEPPSVEDGTEDVPADTAPADTAPADAAPADTAPADTPPAVFPSTDAPDQAAP